MFLASRTLCYYKVLGLQQGASQGQVRQAYLKRAK
jgi:curved DNA-binding protein CbpA